jgi:hypothetical protein
MRIIIGQAIQKSSYFSPGCFLLAIRPIDLKSPSFL